jgi:hypothetical protein
MADQTYETRGGAESIGNWPPLLADNECQHGAMPHDKDIRCGCWGSAVKIAMAIMDEDVAA